MPPSALVPAPGRLPDKTTARPSRWSVKVAETVCAALIATWQVDVPVQSPPQPENVEPVAGTAIRVTAAPWAKLAEHAAPQSIPAGLLVTLPAPSPAFVTASCCVGATTWNEPFMSDECGSQTKVYLPTWNVTVQDVSPVPLTEVLLSTPGPVR